MSTTILDQARDLVAQLAANDVSFEFRPNDGVLPSYFTYSLPRGGDRWKCRGLILEAKADPALWHEVVAEIGRRCGREGAA